MSRGEPPKAWRWTFRHFADTQRHSVIAQEISERGVAGIGLKAALDTYIRQVSVIRELKPPHTKRLDEGRWRGSGLFELRFRVGDILYRPIACYGPGERSITILTIGEKRAGRLIPDDEAIRKLATTRKEILDGDPKRVVDHISGQMARDSGRPS